MVLKRNHRVPATRTRARVSGRAVPVVNLSLGGACLATHPGGRTVELTLEHPHVSERASLRAEVMWARAAGGKPQVGVRFVDPGPGERTLLRRCMLAEYGHGVWAAPDAERPIGYIVPTSDDAWGVFDDAVNPIGTLRREGTLLFLRAHDEHNDIIVPGFHEAATCAFGLSRTPRIYPPLDTLLAPESSPWSAGPSRSVAPSRQPSSPGRLPMLHGSTVHGAGGGLVGYVARVRESWSFFDPRREPLGFMTRSASGEWNVVVLGASEDSEVIVRRAASYPDALAAAFGLGHHPDLRSAVFKPARLLDE